MDTKKNTTQAQAQSTADKLGSTPKRTRKEITFVDALDQADTELRKARQIISEFYDEICCSEDDYPTLEGFIKPDKLNSYCGSKAFRIIEGFPRIATLLNAACDHLGDGHTIIVNALCETGERTIDSTLVIG